MEHGEILLHRGSSEAVETPWAWLERYYYTEAAQRQWRHQAFQLGEILLHRGSSEAVETPWA